MDFHAQFNDGRELTATSFNLENNVGICVSNERVRSATRLTRDQAREFGKRLVEWANAD